MNILKNNLSPICLFTYNRLSETKQTIEALKQNCLASKSELFIFSDGPKDNSDLSKVIDVRQYLKTISGFKSINIYEARENKGLANSIVSGVTKIIKKYGRVIVLEDDIITSYGFLRYMNDALNYYIYEDDVMQVSSFMFPIDTKYLPDSFFYQANTCWGWGTWARAWKFYDDNTTNIISRLKEKRISWNTFNAMQGNEFKKQLFNNYKNFRYYILRNLVDNF